MDAPPKVRRVEMQARSPRTALMVIAAAAPECTPRQYASLPVVKLTNKDGLPRVVLVEGHNIVDEAREAPTEDHLGVLVHVQS